MDDSQNTTDWRSRPRNTPDTFWRRVARLSTHECWEWQGRRNEKGYGVIGWNGKPSVGAHRIAWTLTNGAIPEGMCVLHRCDNPPHLFIGTQRENIADRDSKGRTVDPPSRAKLTDDQVRELRRLYESGITQVELAKRFPVSRGNLSKILNRRSYTHVH